MQKLFSLSIFLPALFLFMPSWPWPPRASSWRSPQRRPLPRCWPSCSWAPPPSPCRARPAGVCRGQKARCQWPGWRWRWRLRRCRQWSNGKCPQRSLLAWEKRGVTVLLHYDLIDLVLALTWQSHRSTQGPPSRFGAYLQQASCLQTGPPTIAVNIKLLSPISV